MIVNHLFKKKKKKQVMHRSSTSKRNTSKNKHLRSGAFELFPR